MWVSVEASIPALVQLEQQSTQIGIFMILLFQTVTFHIRIISLCWLCDWCRVIELSVLVLFRNEILPFHLMEQIRENDRLGLELGLRLQDR